MRGVGVGVDVVDGVVVVYPGDFGIFGDFKVSRLEHDVGHANGDFFLAGHVGVV